MIYLKVAEEKDLTTITKLAHVIWNEHYVGIVGQDQVDYMLEKIYNHQSLVDQYGLVWWFLWCWVTHEVVLHPRHDYSGSKWPTRQREL